MQIITLQLRQRVGIVIALLAILTLTLSGCVVDSSQLAGTTVIRNIRKSSICVMLKNFGTGGILAAVGGVVVAAPPSASGQIQYYNEIFNLGESSTLITYDNGFVKQDAGTTHVGAIGGPVTLMSPPSPIMHMIAWYFIPVGNGYKLQNDGSRLLLQAGPDRSVTVATDQSLPNQVWTSTIKTCPRL